MNARELALRVVCDVFPAAGSHVVERGAQAAFDYRSRRAGLSARDRAFATELAYGAIKMRRMLDWYLEPFIGGRASMLPPTIRELLRLAIYELAFTRADAYATVFEFVNLAKRCAHGGLGNLVNAVLRRFLREKPQGPQREQFGDERDYLATRYSLPTWLVRQWGEVFSGQVETVCAGVNDPAASAVVVDVRKATRDEIALQLASQGIETRPSPLVPQTLLIERDGLPAATAGEGTWWIQSESSAVAVDVLSPQRGEAILDVCSGRGNKAMQIGSRLDGEGTLFCIERDGRKVGPMSDRLASAGIVAAIVTGDASAEILPQEQRFDRVLIDAPCSGTGVVGRHPEARWKKQPSDGERLAVMQRALLEQMARHVYPGGTLVYSVCSADPRETTEVIDEFLARASFERGLIPASYAELLTPPGDVLIPPGINGRDGFYIARMERRA